jgi:general secretion pathway protein H
MTLVEALTALMVVGLVAGAAVLLAPSADRRTRVEAERLAARIQLASEEGVLVNRAHALVMTAEGYGFERLEASGWTPAPLGTPLAFRSWPRRIEAEIEAELGGETGHRIALFDTLGGATPATLVLSEGAVRWRISIAGNGRVDVAPAD